MIFRVLLAILFTGVYALMLASYAWEDLLLGLIFSVILMTIFRNVVLPSEMPTNLATFRVLRAAPRYLVMIVRDIFTGTWLVAQVVLGLKPNAHPGIIKVSIGDHNERAVGVAGLFLTLSPGSFLIDIDWDERVMLVHVIDATNWEKVHDDMLEYFTLLDAALNGDTHPNRVRSGRDA